jgi:hypothetical protein
MGLFRSLGKGSTPEMSGNLAYRVWCSALDPELKPLAAVLATLADDSGKRIFPSVAYLSWLTGKSERAVQYKLKRLREIGVIGIITPAKGHKTCLYRMYEAQLPTRKLWKTPARGAIGFTPGVQPASPLGVQRVAPYTLVGYVSSKKKAPSARSIERFPTYEELKASGRAE